MGITPGAPNEPRDRRPDEDGGAPAPPPPPPPAPPETGGGGGGAPGPSPYDPFDDPLANPLPQPYPEPPSGEPGGDGGAPSMPPPERPAEPVPEGNYEPPPPPPPPAIPPPPFRPVDPFDSAPPLSEPPVDPFDDGLPAAVGAGEPLPPPPTGIRARTQTERARDTADREPGWTEPGEGRYRAAPPSLTSAPPMPDSRPALPAPGGLPPTGQPLPEGVLDTQGRPPRVVVVPEGTWGDLQGMDRPPPPPPPPSEGPLRDRQRTLAEQLQRDAERLRSSLDTVLEEYIRERNEAMLRDLTEQFLAEREGGYIRDRREYYQDLVNRGQMTIAEAQAALDADIERWWSDVVAERVRQEQVQLGVAQDMARQLFTSDVQRLLDAMSETLERELAALQRAQLRWETLRSGITGPVTGPPTNLQRAGEFLGSIGSDLGQAADAMRRLAENLNARPLTLRDVVDAMTLAPKWWQLWREGALSMTTPVAALQGPLLGVTTTLRTLALWRPDVFEPLGAAGWAALTAGAKPFLAALALLEIAPETAGVTMYRAHLEWEMVSEALRERGFDLERHPYLAHELASVYAGTYGDPEAIERNLHGMWNRPVLRAAIDALPYEEYDLIRRMAAYRTPADVGIGEALARINPAWDVPIDGPLIGAINRAFGGERTYADVIGFGMEMFLDPTWLLALATALPTAGQSVVARGSAQGVLASVRAAGRALAREWATSGARGVAAMTARGIGQAAVGTAQLALDVIPAIPFRTAAALGAREGGIALGGLYGFLVPPEHNVILNAPVPAMAELRNAIESIDDPFIKSVASGYATAIVAGFGARALDVLPMARNRLWVEAERRGLFWLSAVVPAKPGMMVIDAPNAPNGATALLLYHAYTDADGVMRYANPVLEGAMGVGLAGRVREARPDELVVVPWSPLLYTRSSYATGALEDAYLALNALFNAADGHPQPAVQALLNGAQALMDGKSFDDALAAVARTPGIVLSEEALKRIPAIGQTLRHTTEAFRSWLAVGGQPPAAGQVAAVLREFISMHNGDATAVFEAVLARLNDHIVETYRITQPDTNIGRYLALTRQLATMPETMDALVRADPTLREALAYGGPIFRQMEKAKRASGGTFADADRAALDVIRRAQEAYHRASQMPGSLLGTDRIRKPLALRDEMYGSNINLVLDIAQGTKALLTPFFLTYRTAYALANVAFNMVMGLVTTHGQMVRYLRAEDRQAALRARGEVSYPPWVTEAPMPMVADISTGAATVTTPPPRGPLRRRLHQVLPRVPGGTALLNLPSYLVHPLIVPVAAAVGGVVGAATGGPAAIVPGAVVGGLMTLGSLAQLVAPLTERWSREVLFTAGYAREFDSAFRAASRAEALQAGLSEADADRYASWKLAAQLGVGTRLPSIDVSVLPTGLRDLFVRRYIEADGDSAAFLRSIERDVTNIENELRRYAETMPQEVAQVLAGSATKPYNPSRQMVQALSDSALAVLAERAPRVQQRLKEWTAALQAQTSGAPVSGPTVQALHDAYRAAQARELERLKALRDGTPLPEHVDLLRAAGLAIEPPKTAYDRFVDRRRAEEGVIALERTELFDAAREELAKAATTGVVAPELTGLRRHAALLGRAAFEASEADKQRGGGGRPWTRAAVAQLVLNVHFAADAVARLLRDDPSMTIDRFFDEYPVDIRLDMRETEGGRLEFSASGTTVTLGERANAETLVHEMHHVWMRFMLEHADLYAAELTALHEGLLAATTASAARRGVAPLTVRPIEEWLTPTAAPVSQPGAGPAGTFFPELEALARLFVVYLREGKAPTQTLKSVFALFKEWLRRLYRRLTGSDIDFRLTDRTRRAFDQILGAPHTLPIPASAPVTRLAATRSATLLHYVPFSPAAKAASARYFANLEKTARQGARDAYHRIDDALRQAGEAAAAPEVVASVPGGPAASVPVLGMPALADLVKLVDWGASGIAWVPSVTDRLRAWGVPDSVIPFVSALLGLASARNMTWQTIENAFALGAAAIEVANDLVAEAGGAPVTVPKPEDVFRRIEEKLRTAIPGGASVALLWQHVPGAAAMVFGEGVFTLERQKSAQMSATLVGQYAAQPVSTAMVDVWLQRALGYGRKTATLSRVYQQASAAFGGDEAALMTAVRERIRELTETRQGNPFAGLSTSIIHADIAHAYASGVIDAATASRYRDAVNRRKTKLTDEERAMLRAAESLPPSPSVPMADRVIAALYDGWGAGDVTNERYDFVHGVLLKLARDTENLPSDVQSALWVAARHLEQNGKLFAIVTGAMTVEDVLATEGKQIALDLELERSRDVVPAAAPRFVDALRRLAETAESATATPAQRAFAQETLRTITERAGLVAGMDATDVLDDAATPRYAVSTRQPLETTAPADELPAIHLSGIPTPSDWARYETDLVVDEHRVVLQDLNALGIRNWVREERDNTVTITVAASPYAARWAAAAMALAYEPTEAAYSYVDDNGRRQRETLDVTDRNALTRILLDEQPTFNLRRVLGSVSAGGSLASVLRERLKPVSAGDLSVEARKHVDRLDASGVTVPDDALAALEATEFQTVSGATALPAIQTLDDLAMAMVARADTVRDVSPRDASALEAVVRALEAKRGADVVARGAALTRAVLLREAERLSTELDNTLALVPTPDVAALGMPHLALAERASAWHEAAQRWVEAARPDGVAATASLALGPLRALAVLAPFEPQSREYLTRVWSALRERLRAETPVGLESLIAAEEAAFVALQDASTALTRLDGELRHDREAQATVARLVAQRTVVRTLLDLLQHDELAAALALADPGLVAPQLSPTMGRTVATRAITASSRDRSVRLDVLAEQRGRSATIVFMETALHASAVKDLGLMVDGNDVVLRDVVDTMRDATMETFAADRRMVARLVARTVEALLPDDIVAEVGRSPSLADVDATLVEMLGGTQPAEALKLAADAAAHIWTPLAARLGDVLTAATPRPSRAVAEWAVHVRNYLLRWMTERALESVTIRPDRIRYGDWIVPAMVRWQTMADGSVNVMAETGALTGFLTVSVTTTPERLESALDAQRIHPAVGLVVAARVAAGQRTGTASFGDLATVAVAQVRAQRSATHALAAALRAVNRDEMAAEFSVEETEDGAFVVRRLETAARPHATTVAEGDGGWFITSPLASQVQAGTALEMDVPVFGVYDMSVVEGGGTDVVHVLPKEEVQRVMEVAPPPWWAGFERVAFLGLERDAREGARRRVRQLLDESPAFRAFVEQTTLRDPDYPELPLVVWHGTMNQFDRFAVGDMGFHFGTFRAAMERTSDLTDQFTLGLLDPQSEDGWTGRFRHPLEDTPIAADVVLDPPRLEWNDAFLRTLAGRLNEVNREIASGASGTWTYPILLGVARLPRGIAVELVVALTASHSSWSTRFELKLQVGRTTFADGKSVEPEGLVIEQTALRRLEYAANVFVGERDAVRWEEEYRPDVDALRASLERAMPMFYLQQVASRGELQQPRVDLRRVEQGQVRDASGRILEYRAVPVLAVGAPSGEMVLLSVRSTEGGGQVFGVPLEPGIALGVLFADNRPIARFRANVDNLATFDTAAVELARDIYGRDPTRQMRWGAMKAARPFVGAIWMPFVVSARRLLRAPDVGSWFFSTRLLRALLEHNRDLGKEGRALLKSLERLAKKIERRKTPFDLSDSEQTLILEAVERFAAERREVDMPLDEWEYRRTVRDFTELPIMDEDVRPVLSYPIVMSALSRYLAYRLTELGFDGVAYRNGVEDIGSTSYLVFDQRRVKNIINNQTFDPANWSFLKHTVSSPNRPPNLRPAALLEWAGFGPTDPNWNGINSKRDLTVLLGAAEAARPLALDAQRAYIALSEALAGIQELVEDRSVSADDVGSLLSQLMVDPNAVPRNRAGQPYEARVVGRFLPLAQAYEAFLNAEAAYAQATSSIGGAMRNTLTDEEWRALLAAIPDDRHPSGSLVWLAEDAPLTPPPYLRERWMRLAHDVLATRRGVPEQFLEVSRKTGQRALNDAVAAAQAEALRKAQAALFSYSRDRTYTHFFADHISYYSYWAMQHMTRVLRVVARHPGVALMGLLILQKWREQTEDEPPAYRWSAQVMSLPGVGRFRFRPWNAFAPVADQGVIDILEWYSDDSSKAAADERRWLMWLAEMWGIRTAPHIQVLVDILSQVDTPTPADEIARWMTGADDPRSRASDLFRQSRLLRSMTGGAVDIEGGTIFGAEFPSLRQLRYGTTELGRETFWTGVELARRVQRGELSAAEARQASYSAAMGQPNAVWKEARAYVLTERGRVDLVNYLLPLGISFIPEQYDYNRRMASLYYGVPQLSPEARRALLDVNPAVGVAWAANDPVLQQRQMTEAVLFFDALRKLNADYAARRDALRDRYMRGEIGQQAWREQEWRLREEERAEEQALRERYPLAGLPSLRRADEDTLARVHADVRREAYLDALAELTRRYREREEQLSRDLVEGRIRTGAEWRSLQTKLNEERRKESQALAERFADVRLPPPQTSAIRAVRDRADAELRLLAERVSRGELTPEAYQAAVSDVAKRRDDAIAELREQVKAGIPVDRESAYSIYYQLGDGTAEGARRQQAFLRELPEAWRNYVLAEIQKNWTEAERRWHTVIAPILDEYNAIPKYTRGTPEEQARWEAAGDTWNATYAKAMEGKPNTTANRRAAAALADAAVRAAGLSLADVDAHRRYENPERKAFRESDRYKPVREWYSGASSASGSSGGASASGQGDAASAAGAGSAALAGPPAGGGVVAQPQGAAQPGAAQQVVTPPGLVADDGQFNWALYRSLRQGDAEARRQAREMYVDAAARGLVKWGAATPPDPKRVRLENERARLLEQRPPAGPERWRWYLDGNGERLNALNRQLGAQRVVYPTREQAQRYFEHQALEAYYDRLRELDPRAAARWYYEMGGRERLAALRDAYLGRRPAHAPPPAVATAPQAARAEEERQAGQTLPLGVMSALRRLGGDEVRQVLEWAAGRRGVPTGQLWSALRSGYSSDSDYLAALRAMAALLGRR